MAQSSILGGTPAAAHASGRDTDALGPSDSSDSGSDIQGSAGRRDGAIGPGAREAELASDSDAEGTGERGSARQSENVRAGADIAPNRIRRFADAAADDLGTDDSALAEVDELLAGDADAIDEDDPNAEPPGE